MWNPLKRGKWRKQIRNPDGTFGGTDTAENTAMTRAKAVKAEVGMLTEVAKLNKEIAAMQQAQDEAAAARAKAMQQQAMDLAEQFAPADEEGGEPSIEHTLMAAAAPFLPQLLAKFTNSQNPKPFESSPEPNGGSPPQAAPLPSGLKFKDQPDPANAQSQLNQVLADLAKVPDRLFTKAMVTKVCKAQGIDETNLKKVVKKLSKV